MTQPPYGETPSGWHPPYPQQQLLPQEVKPGRSRLPMVVAAAATALLLVGGLLAWWLLRDDGEQNRAAYCAALRTATHGGELPSELQGSLQEAATTLGRVRDLAPAAVRSQWEDLLAIVAHPPSGRVDIATGLRVVNDLRVIVADANGKCGLDIQTPIGLN